MKIHSEAYSALKNKFFKLSAPELCRFYNQDVEK